MSAFIFRLGDSSTTGNSGAAQGIGVKGKASGADSELGQSNGESEQIVVGFDEDVSEASVQFAWMNPNEGAVITLYNDGEEVGSFEVRGGSDTIDPPVTFELTP